MTTTSTTDTWVEVTDAEALRELVGEPTPAARECSDSDSYVKRLY